MGSRSTRRGLEIGTSAVFVAVLGFAGIGGSACKKGGTEVGGTLAPTPTASTPASAADVAPSRPVAILSQPPASTAPTEVPPAVPAVPSPPSLCTVPSRSSFHLRATETNASQGREYPEGTRIEIQAAGTRQRRGSTMYRVRVVDDDAVGWIYLDAQELAGCFPGSPQSTPPATTPAPATQSDDDSPDDLTTASGRCQSRCRATFGPRCIDRCGRGNFTGMGNCISRCTDHFTNCAWRCIPPSER